MVCSGDDPAHAGGVPTPPNPYLRIDLGLDLGACMSSSNALHQGRTVSFTF